MQGQNVSTTRLDLKPGDRIDRYELLRELGHADQVLAGLSGIHSEGAVHRDVKPANINLQPRRAVVMDLGLAHISGGAELAVSGQIFGTPRYMAPEQARGEKVTHQSDLYAVGVVLYEMLTGTIPHQADTTPSLIFNIALEEPKPVTHYRSNLPPTLVSCLHCLLEREPARRFSPTQCARNALLTSVGMRDVDLAAIHQEIYDKVHTVRSQ
jgi:serine/threonine-protein kinase